MRRLTNPLQTVFIILLAYLGVGIIWFAIVLVTI